MKNQTLKIMGIIGIRSGSTGLPGKNIKPLGGLPLVGWIINSAKNSKFINRIIVSTDDNEYAEVAKKHGAEVLYMRPKNLATDLSPEFDFINHMLKWLKDSQNYIPDIIVRLLATSPLQSPADIDQAIEILLQDEKADSSVVISEMRQHPLKALKIVEDEKYGKRLISYFGESGLEVTGIARQNYEKAYVRSNVIVSKIQTILDTNSLTGHNVKFHIIPQESSIDIDNQADFDYAEYFVEKNYKK